MTAVKIPTEDFVRAIWKPGEVREVRILDGRRTAAGWFDNVDILLGAIDAWDGKAQIYLTINPVKRALLARKPPNQIHPDVKTTTSNRDIDRRRWLYIDLDPERPTEVSASEEEHQAAVERGREVYAYLREQGWSAPISGDTGNGMAMLYPIDLPNDDEATRTVEGVLAHLNQKFSDERVKVDVTVGNAARIGRLFGTLNIKGADVPERPHRRSRVLDVPGELVPIPTEQLQALVPATNGHGPQAADTSNWLKPLLDHHHVEYRERTDRDGATWYLLHECPFHPGEDLDGRCGVGSLPSGMVIGKCFHDRGAGKGWQEFKAALGLVKTTHAPKHKTAVAPVLRFYTPRELAAEASAEADWLVHGLLAAEAITEVDGKVKKAGKTTLALALVGSLLDGLPFLGYAVKPTNVVYLTEQQRGPFQNALRTAGLNEREAGLYVLFRRDFVGVAWPEVVAAVVAKCLEVNAGAFVVDTIAKLAGIRSENDPGDWNDALAPLQDAASDHRLGILLTRHDRKGGGEVGESGRGSSAGSGEVDIILQLKRPDGANALRPTRRVLESESRYEETPERIVIEFGPEGYANLGTEDAVSLADGVRFVSGHLRENHDRKETEGVTRDQLVVLGEDNDPRLSASTIRRALADLEKKWAIHRVGRGVKNDPFRYLWGAPPEDGARE